jgi:prepilin-type N-terminal cleavage/methylation domain-containing protein/prepilin-type processing-associated H-X9-DG protein
MAVGRGEGDGPRGVWCADWNSMKGMNELPAAHAMFPRTPARRSSPRKGTGPGFTIIELLVVMAILALLTALLLPVISSARERSHQAACASNLKQIGSALMLYASDHDGFIPSWNFASHTEYTYPNGWYYGQYGLGHPVSGLRYLAYEGYLKGFSKPSLNERPTTTCPSFWPKVPKEQGWGGGYPHHTAYMHGGTYAFNAHLDRSIGLSFPGVQMRRIFTVPNISKRFIYGEGASSQCRIHSSTNSHFNIWWGHNGSANFLFGDGHVAAYSQKDIPLATGWPTQPWGTDSPLGAPW